MTREEIKNTPEIVDLMLSESVMPESRKKLLKRLDEICNLAIQALEQEPKTEWIPVSERLPEDVVSNYDIRCSEDVLVYDGDDLRVGYFVRSEKLDYGYWNIYGDDCFEPVAWMPLPEPYKAESEGKE